MLRLLQNAVLYFLILPATYVCAMLLQDTREVVSAADVLMGFVFSTPVWPLVFVFVPVITVIVLVAEKNGGRTRATAIVGSALLVGVTATYLYRSLWVSIVALSGGALYGILFRLPLRTTLPGSAQRRDSRQQ
jgi:hypothetical protein